MALHNVLGSGIIRPPRFSELADTGSQKPVNVSGSGLDVTSGDYAYLGLFGDLFTFEEPNNGDILEISDLGSPPARITIKVGSTIVHEEDGLNVTVASNGELVFNGTVADVFPPIGNPASVIKSS